MTESIVDRTTPVLGAVGVGTGYVGAPLWVGVLGLLLYEAMRNGWSTRESKTIANQTADVVVSVAGYYVGRWLRGAVRT